MLHVLVARPGLGPGVEGHDPLAALEAVARAVAAVARVLEVAADHQHAAVGQQGLTRAPQVGRHRAVVGEGIVAPVPGHRRRRDRLRRVGQRIPHVGVAAVNRLVLGRPLGLGEVEDLVGRHHHRVDRRGGMLNSGPHRPSGCWLSCAVTSSAAIRAVRTCAVLAPSSGQKASWLARHAASEHSLSRARPASSRRATPTGGRGCGRSRRPRPGSGSEMALGTRSVLAAEDHRAQRDHRGQRRRRGAQPEDPAAPRVPAGDRAPPVFVGYRSVYRHAGRRSKEAAAAPEWGACRPTPSYSRSRTPTPSPLRPGRRRLPRRPAPQLRRRRARAPLVDRGRPVQGARVPRGARGKFDGVPVPGPPFDVVRAELARHPQAAVGAAEGFRGGAIGYVGYEMGRHLERLPRPPADPDGRAGDAAPVLRRGGRVRPPRARRAHIISTGQPEPVGDRRRARALERLRAATRRYGEPGAPAAPVPVAAAPDGEPDIPREAYELAVRRVVDYILAGDIFQANLSQRLR